MKKRATSPDGLTPRRKAPGYKNPPRYRLDFIRENTFNRVWSLRMTRVRVILVTLAIVAGGAALLWVALAFTPLRYLVPGTLHGDLRARYVDVAVRLDSLEEAARINQAYLSNVNTILRGDTVPTVVSALSEPVATDSLLSSGAAERDFVRRYEEEERFSLSVLAPIAAEGMVFVSPVATVKAQEHLPSGALRITAGRGAPVSAVYRGTVISVSTDGDASSTVIVQHPSDFVSVYSGLGDIFVEPGQRVEAGQRLAHALRSGDIEFKLWHSGTALDPREYIAF